jgi:hypothetical protein
MNKLSMFVYNLNINKMKQLTETEFDETIELIENFLDDNASFSGHMFETYGEELDFVLEMAKENRVITIVESGDETETNDSGELNPCMYYISGYHLVNRIGYLITKEPITEDFETKIE